MLNRLDKAHAAMLHQEIDGIPMPAAAKTMIKLLGRAYCEGGSFFIMEGTTRRKIGACFFEWQMTRDHIDDIDASEQILNKRLFNHLLEK